MPAAQAPGGPAGAGARAGRAPLHSPRWPGRSSGPQPRPPLPRAAVRPWPPEGGSAVLIPPLAATVPSCWRRRRDSGRRAAAGAQHPPWRPPRARVTHVEAGVLGAEEREEHGERPQPGAAVVLLGGDGVAALRAERVEVGEGHRAAHAARPEPQGRGQEQRPGGAARHRWGSAGGNGAGDTAGRNGDREGRSAGHSEDAAGTDRRRGRAAGGRSGACGHRGAGARPRSGVARRAGRPGVRAARPRRWWTPESRSRSRSAGPRSGRLSLRKAPGGTAFGAGPAPAAAI